MYSRQTTSTVMMIEPHYFCFNEEAFQTNEFQNKPSKRQGEITSEAFDEYRKSVKLLTDAGVKVLSLQEKNVTKVPDAVFCNNWVSTCPDGNIVVYPMLNANRKEETKQLASIQRLFKDHLVKNVISLGNGMDETEALEGTGSMVIDHDSKIIFAAKSQRTKEFQIKNLIETVKYYNDFTYILYDTKSSTGKEYYHTNIVMCIGSKFAIVCLESIQSNRDVVLKALQGKDIVDISIEQAEKYFCGNAIQVKNQNGDPLIVMSQRAWSGFSPSQQQTLSKHGKIIQFPLATIEHIGGGSARCMIAEIFLPLK